MPKNDQKIFHLTNPGACLKSSLDFFDAMVRTDYFDSLRETLAIGWLRELCTRLLKKTWYHL
jgi:hypothetical protein